MEKTTAALRLRKRRELKPSRTALAEAKVKMPAEVFGRNIIAQIVSGFWEGQKDFFSTTGVLTFFLDKIQN